MSPFIALALHCQAKPSHSGWIWMEPARPAARLAEPARTGGFGHRVLTLADVDEDGVPDLAIGAPLDVVVGSHPGRLFLVSGRTGTLLSQRPLAIAIQVPHPVLVEDLDLDGDRAGEWFVPTGEDGPVAAWSSRTGKPWIAMQHDDPGGYLEDFGASIAPAGDLDQDGTVDVAIGCSEFPADSGDAYAVEIFSGRDGRLLLSIDTMRKSVTVASAADFNGDGRLDLPVGLPEDEVVLVLDGSTLRKRLGSPHRVRLEETVLRAFSRGSYPSGSPDDPFPVLPSRSGDR